MSVSYMLFLGIITLYLYICLHSFVESLSEITANYYYAPPQLQRQPLSPLFNTINSNPDAPPSLLPTLMAASGTLRSISILHNPSETPRSIDKSDKLEDLLDKSREHSSAARGQKLEHFILLKRSDTNSVESSSLDSDHDLPSSSFLSEPQQIVSSSSSSNGDIKPIIDTHTVDDSEEPETHTNNHQLGNQAIIQNGHNSRSHHNNYQLSGSSTSSVSNSLITPSTSNHHSATSASSVNGNNNANKYHNFNLNYIHSLLTKPASSSSLGSLLNGNQNNSPLGPSYYSLALQNAYSSSYHSAPSMNNIQQQQQPVQSASQKQHLYLNTQSSNQFNQPEQLQNNSTNSQNQISDIPATFNCGRQQVGYREPRIVGGNNTYEGEFPWAVSIQRYGNHHCGGVIVGKRWILTAAHCVRSQQVANLIVRTGGHTLTRSSNNVNSHLERDYLVEQIIMHNDFSRYDNLTASQMKSSANINNADIALLRLKHDIHWNELAWPVCFPNREAGNFSGHDAIVIGWGKLNEKSEDFSNELQKVKLTIIDNKVCQNWFRQAGREMPIDDRIICAGFKNGGKDACHGDSGGPLLSKIDGHYVVVGVVSTGIGCARPLLPGLYSRVSSYIGWIERYVV